MTIVYIARAENQVYVGVTKDLASRIRCHRHAYNHKTRTAKLFNCAFEDIKFKVVYEGERKECFLIETCLIDYFRSEENIHCLNEKLSTNPQKRFETKRQELVYKKLVKMGTTMTEDAKNKISESLYKYYSNKPYFLIHDISGNLILRENSIERAAKTLGIADKSLRRYLKKERTSKNYRIEMEALWQ